MRRAVGITSYHSGQQRLAEQRARRKKDNIIYFPVKDLDAIRLERMQKNTDRMGYAAIVLAFVVVALIVVVQVALW